jgi:hypothetical protein
MNLQPLENLVKSGNLQRESLAMMELAEIDGLISSGTRRLKDARNDALSVESRFDLAYNAAHALALAALRLCGYRSTNRYTVFQVLPHTLGLENEKWRVLDSAHKKRNSSEYDGVFDVDLSLVESVIRVAGDLDAGVRALFASKRQELG